MDLRTDLHFFQLLSDSYTRLLKRLLVPVSELGTEEAARWLYEKAPFALLVHNTAPDPTFIYGNRAAQKRFEYDWDELTALPSRLSAEAPLRDERKDFLDRVTRNGFIDNYRGVRITKNGKRFWIEDSVVWQFTDAHGQSLGQAAIIPRSRDI